MKNYKWTHTHVLSQRPYLLIEFKTWKKRGVLILYYESLLKFYCIKHKGKFYSIGLENDYDLLNLKAIIIYFSWKQF